MPDTSEPNDRRPHRHPYDRHHDFYDPYLRGRRLSTKDCLLQLLGMAVVACLVSFGISKVVEHVSREQAFEKAVYAEATQVWTTTETVRLAAMSSGTSTSVSGGGDSFLGTGAFVVRTSEDQRLRYVERRDEGGYVMGSVSAESAVIYEIDEGSGQQPRIETQACHVESKGPEHRAWIDEDREHRSRCRTEGSSFGHEAERLRVYVPAGTVVDAYSVGPEK